MMAMIQHIMSHHTRMMTRAKSVSWLQLYPDVWQEQDLLCIDLPGVLVHPQLLSMHTPVACFCKLIIGNVVLSLYSSSRMQEALQ